MTATHTAARPEFVDATIDQITCELQEALKRGRRRAVTHPEVLLGCGPWRAVSAGDQTRCSSASCHTATVVDRPSLRLR
jgi:hypothetical protein